MTDAELRSQNYVLTGETVYADDMRNWQDESAAQEVMARNDRAAPLVQKAGTHTLNELGAVVSTFRKKRAMQYP